MKINLLRHLVLFLIAATAFCASADNEPRDTVYFYDTWQQMLEMSPSAMIVSPIIETENPYEVDIYTTQDDYRLYNHLAATIGDSIWLVSTAYLQTNFEGDSEKPCGGRFLYVPLFFNEKVAYLMAPTYGIKEILFGPMEVTSSNDVDYYYFDFKNRELRKVSSSVLSELLEDYHDLQMRYEGMKDYKKKYMIEEFFMRYVDRASQDFMRPYIIDLVE